LDSFFAQGHGIFFGGGDFSLFVSRKKQADDNGKDDRGNKKKKKVNAFVCPIG